MTVKAQTLQPVKESGWRSGFSNLMRNELRGWWGTRTWWLQSLIWLFVINGSLAPALASKPEAGFGPFMLFSSVTGMFVPLGAIILTQGRVIGEKRSGTAAWILSKPVSRSAFLLSKLLADILGFFTTVIVLQGVVAYAQFAFVGIAPPIPAFLVTMGMLFLNLLFYVALTLMLGTIFDSRPAVIGTAVFALFLLIELAQDTTFGQFLPGSLLFGAGKMLAGNPFPYAIPLVGATVLSVLLVVAAFRRFGREEF